MIRPGLRHSVFLLAALAFAACGGDETEPEEGFGDELVLSVGEAVTVEVRFLDEDGAVITGIEDEHHAELTFTPRRWRRWRACPATTSRSS